MNRWENGFHKAKNFICFQPFSPPGTCSSESISAGSTPEKNYRLKYLNSIYIYIYILLNYFRSKEAVMKESPGTLRKPANKLWSCAMANAPPSTWQHESLEGVIKFGTTIRRQPTKTEFKNIKKLLFTSRKWSLSFSRRLLR